MKLLKPAWVSHDERSLFCVDIHPDGSRFATGGQGQDRTGTIAVWNMAPVESERAELDAAVPRQLCRLDDHLGCVNCLRWSADGRHLASGGDDKLVMVWRHTKTGGAAPFGSSQPCLEGWRAVTTLRAHDGDVIALAWSPEDRYLATCSVDNLVLVWDAARWGDVVARLRGHTGLVKGVDWDPVGRYLVSQSDDRTLRVWRTADWQAETVVVDPFQCTGGTTAVLRCGWSPDGRYIVSAHAMNNGGPTAQIVDRNDWTTNKDFVGHKKAITCVRFNGAMLQRSRGVGQKPEMYCACALGSRDRGLSVWLTCLRRPLVVLHELFDDSVMDLSWHPARRLLIACSKDGTVACISFSAEELLGDYMTASEQRALHQRLRKQIECRTPDGKRRITPMFVPSQDVATEGPAPFASERPFTSSSGTSPSVMVEKRDQVVTPQVKRRPDRDLRAAAKRLRASPPDGQPVLVLSTGRAYLYSSKLAAWLLLTDCGAPGAGAGLAADASAAYIDSQVAAAVALGSPAEYRLWLGALVRQLTARGDERRLRDLLQQLLGPAHSGAALSHCPPTELGLDRRQLLRELLPLLVSELSVQRLYTEIKDQLDCLELAASL
ncbi:LOW QUALITY PROTEIN: protein HIRA-like [Pollicipes pollicipes]|uniref:LOW QUALITY PROTEIN: protein HIRA-like n=1 Tax=Pollicipes pollicipes TaxID=41117 RepID=UPI001884B680|nr:LOW QUALITY PROTEIN: protein HIRA-like [Pollicipes pollicipes]